MTPPRRPQVSAGLVVALALLALAIIGLLHVRYGGWRSGTGVGGYLVPMLAYWAIILSVVPILLGYLRGQGSQRRAELPAPLLPLLAAALWGGLFFLAVLHLGVFAGATLGLGTAMLLLSGRGQPMLPLVALAVVLGAAFWVMFTHVAPVLLRAPLLV